MVYCGWTVGMLIGHCMVGLSGYTESFAAAFSLAIGDDGLILCLLAFILFGGGLASSKSMEYVTKFILTRKFIAGKPYIILATIGVCSYLLAFVVNQMVAAIIMFSIVVAICRTVGIEHGEDKIWIYMFGMIFLGAGIGQPGFVNKGIGLALILCFTTRGRGFWYH